MKTFFRVVLGLVPAVYLTLVGTWNEQLVDVDLLVYTFEQQSLGVVVLGALLVGVGLTSLAFTWPMIRVRLRLRSESKRVAQLEQEVHGLRTLPLSDDDDEAKAEAREG